MKCDMVVAVLHGGHQDDEDVGLLNLQNVDIVLGGHTHESYLYSSSDSSLTSQCGSYGMKVTALSVGMDINKNLHFKGVDEEYNQFVSADSPQCINVTSGIAEDSGFNKKVGNWKGEIKRLRGIDPDQILFHGNLTQLLQPSISREANAWMFAHMLVDEFNKWDQKNNPGSDTVTLTFWTKNFLGYEQLNHDFSDVIITFDDAYSLIYITASRELYTFYVTKEELYCIIQGMFIMNALVSPLMEVSAGGILYNEKNYLGVPIITDLRTVNEVPYEKLPPNVRVLTNSFSAPYFWKMDKFSFGFMDNPAKDKDGNHIDLDDALVPNSPNELDLFLNYLQKLNEL